MLNPDSTLVLGIDIQEKLVHALFENSKVAQNNCLKLIKAAKTLNIEMIITEQYPKGLGKTIDSIVQVLGCDYIPFEKTFFSAIYEDIIFNKIIKSNKKDIVLFGIEAHICVFQTALDLKEKGFNVCVVSDCTFSRNDDEKKLALKNLRLNKIMTLSLETILFMWLKSSKHSNFKEIQALIK